MDRALVVESLRAAMRTKETAPPLPTGWIEVDALLGGGLQAGRLIEVVGDGSSGKLSVALQAIAAVTASGKLAAYVDARHELYPPAAAVLGVDLDRLLMIRPPPDAVAVARAGEILTKSRCFGLVVLDLPEGTQLGERRALRLRAAAHESGTTLMALALASALPQAGIRLAIRTVPGPVRGVRRITVRLLKGGAAPSGESADVRIDSPTHQVARR